MRRYLIALMLVSALFGKGTKNEGEVSAEVFLVELCKPKSLKDFTEKLKYLEENFLSKNNVYDKQIKPKLKDTEEDKAVKKAFELRVKSYIAERDFYKVVLEACEEYNKGGKK